MRPPIRTAINTQPQVEKFELGFESRLITLTYSRRRWIHKLKYFSFSHRSFDWDNTQSGYAIQPPVDHRSTFGVARLSLSRLKGGRTIPAG